jgi:hypothetical protein
MTTKYVLAALVFGTSMSVISWIVGMVGSSLLRRTAYYERWSSLNFIPSSSLNRRIGIKYFKWIVKHTPLRFFNQSIGLRGRRVDLADVRREMTTAEVNHLIGFAFVGTVAIVQGIRVGPGFGLLMTVPNVLLNVYPSLLQQENKHRIDRLLS